MGVPIQSERPVQPATGLRRILLVTGGLLCLVMAYIGALLPGLPTTPWVLLASFCFARSSPRLQRWLLRSPLFGRLLRDWHEHSGIRLPIKILAATMMILACTFSMTMTDLPIGIKAAIAALGCIGLSVIICVVPTIR